MTWSKNRGPAAAYRCFNIIGELLYIGASISPWRRLQDHTRTSDWSKDIHRVELVWFETVRQAEEYEAAAIEAENPQYNVLHIEGLKCPKPQGVPDSVRGSMEPASSIISALGGPTAIASAIGLHRTRVSMWQAPREKGGTNGNIPYRHVPSLLELAKEKGVRLEPPDFFPADVDAPQKEAS